MLLDKYIIDQIIKMLPSAGRLLGQGGMVFQAMSCSVQSLLLAYWLAAQASFLTMLKETYVHQELNLGQSHQKKVLLIVYTGL